MLQCRLRGQRKGANLNEGGWALREGAVDCGFFATSGKLG